MSLVAFSLFAGTSASSAMWSAGANVSGRVESGTVAVTQTGATGLAVTYNLTTLADTAPITITNTGTTTAPHTLQLSAPTGNTFAQAVLVRTWPVAAANQCTAAAIVPAGATLSSLTNVPALTTTLAPSGIAFYCIRTTITAAQQTTLASQSVTITSTVTSALGSWASAPASEAAVQGVTDTAAPSTPAPSARTLRTSTTLTWQPSTDNVATTSYDIYRGGALIANTTSTTFTNTGLATGTTYSYSVRAKDAAGNISGEIPLSVKTVNVQTNTLMVITNSGSGRCLDGNNAGTASGTALIDWSCTGTSNQSWSLAVSTTNYYKITAPYTAGKKVAALAWDYDATGKFVGLYTPNAQIKQDWQVVAVSPDVFQFVNRASGLCLQTGSVTGDGVNTTLATCVAIPQQTFTISVR